ncbi:MAG: glycosyltransferase family 25 protein [Planctomycetia bacterium]|nr:glycosyltransferase family 25 protein [Planctomycetia bacterium]
MSHCQLQEEALEQGLESLLIFEDDATFIDNFEKRVKEFHTMLPIGAEWIFYGGEHFKPERYPIERVNSCVCRANRIVRTHAYGIRSRRAIRQILDWIRSPEGWYHFHVDTRFADLMQRHSVECCAPNRWLVHQRAGHSDIMSKYMDYRFPDAIDYWM